MAGNARRIISLALALCIAAMLCLPALAAQGPAFRLDIDTLNLQPGISVNLILSMINAQGATVVGIEGLESFDLLSQSTSTSINIVGNERTYQEDRYYTIMPKAAGQFALKAVVQYNGGSYETNELLVTVSDAQAGGEEAQADLFVKTVLSKPEAFLGEKLVVTYELYTRYNLQNFGFTDYTAIDGIIARDVPEEQLNAEYVYLGGERYIKYEAKQLILDPIKTGTHTIPSFNMQVNVITDDGPGGVFGGGMSGIFSRTQTVYLQTEPVELTVKPLPQDGKPADFSGIVGYLQIDGRYSREQLNYGDSLSLQVTAAGSCNLDGLKKIISGELSGFTVYETQKNTTEWVESNQYYANKEFEAILVPEKTGAIQAAPASISYFNPATGRYERAEIPSATIEVTGEMPQINSQQGGQGQAAQIERISISQVNYASADLNAEYLSLTVSKKVLCAVLAGAGALIILAAAGIWLWRNSKKRNAALKSLYKQAMAAKDANEAYNLLNEMIKHCYNLSLKASSQSEVTSALPEVLAEKLCWIMSYMEAPEEKNGSVIKEKIREAYSVILRSGKE